jgi:hypothetical protein
MEADGVFFSCNLVVQEGGHVACCAQVTNVRGVDEYRCNIVAAGYFGNVDYCLRVKSSIAFAIALDFSPPCVCSVLREVQSAIARIVVVGRW